MVVYKLRHKPTGLYFTPSRSHGNLSLKGKIYQHPPRLEWTTPIRVIYRDFYKHSKLNNIIKEYFKLEKYIFPSLEKKNRQNWEIRIYTQKKQ